MKSQTPGHEQLSPAKPASVFRIRELFLRCLGLVSLLAFASLWTQVHGLVGSRGILPVRDYLERVSLTLESSAALQLPTLLWLDASDLTLHLLCFAGAVSSAVVIAGRASSTLLFFIWLLYLSLVHGGQTFLSFQWDTLLLETLFWSLFLLPPSFVPRRLAQFTDDPRFGVLLLRLLLFKLMFLSGVVKPLSLDPTWLGLSALDVHYQTQPLPHALSWWAHRLPGWFQATSVVLTYLIEIVLPFALFGPRRLRLVCVAALVSLQLLIMATGNYGFFNLLSLVLCITTLDDACLAWMPSRSERRAPPASGRSSRRLLATAALPLLLSALVSVREMLWTVPRHQLGPGWRRAVELAERFTVEPARPLLDLARPLRSINGYGLFRSMTTERPEIAVEWSSDGTIWQEYQWRYKPSETGRRPRLTGPHMPRLDWQMWFAALAPRRADWLEPFAQRLLESEHSVLALLRDPPSTAPLFVRLVLYDYRFSTAEERRRDGRWWVRERLGELTGPLQIARGR